MIQRISRYRHIIFWVAITVTMTALDWPFGTMTQFWQHYTLTNAIFSGVLLLGLGLFVAEAWFREREARKWNQVAYIATKELGYVSDVLLTGMNYLLTGKRNHEVEIRDESIHDHLQLILERVITGDCERLGAKDRLICLLQDTEWIRLAIIGLDILKHQHRRNLAVWLPVMLTTDKMTSLVNQGAQTNQNVFYLQDILRVILNPDDARFAQENVQTIAQDHDRLVAKAIAHWVTTHEGIIHFQQTCMNTAELIGWESPAEHLRED